MSRINMSGVFMLFFVTLLFSMLSTVTVLTDTGYCAEQEVSTLEAVEVKDDTDAGPAEILLSDVQAAAKISKERIYGLIALWVIIALCIYLVNLQRKDDERLYQDGYYNKDDD